MTGRSQRVVTYRPNTASEQSTIAAWVVRAVLALPAGVDAGQAAALLGVSRRQVCAVRDHNTRKGAR